MDQARLFIAIALSIAVFLVWEMFFVEKPKMPVSEKPAPTDQIDSGEEEPPAAVVKDNTAVNDNKTIDVPAKSGAPAREIVVETPLYIATLSENGATIRSLRLKKFFESIAPDAEMLEMVPHPDLFQVALVTSEQKSVKGLEQAVFTSLYESTQLNVAEKLCT